MKSNAYLNIQSQSLKQYDDQVNVYYLSSSHLTELNRIAWHSIGEICIFFYVEHLYFHLEYDEGFQIACRFNLLEVQRITLIDMKEVRQQVK